MVDVPDTDMPIDETDVEELRRSIDPLRNSLHHGVDIYLEVLNFFEHRLGNNNMNTA